MKHPDLEAVKLGGAQLRFTLGVLFVLVLGPIVTRWAASDTSRIVPELLTLSCTAGVFYNFLHGARWARTVTVVLAMFGGMLAAFIGVFLSGGSNAGYFVFAVGIAFIACGFAIIGLPAIEAYMQHVRPSRRPSREGSK